MTPGLASARSAEWQRDRAMGHRPDCRMGCACGGAAYAGVHAETAREVHFGNEGSRLTAACERAFFADWKRYCAGACALRCCAQSAVNAMLA